VITWNVTVRSPDGQERKLSIQRKTKPTQIWVPGVFCWEDDGVRCHVGLGPWDALLHYSSRPTFEGECSSPGRVSRFSLLTIFQRDRKDTETGSFGRTSLQPLWDLERTSYWLEWDEAKPSTLDEWHWDLSDL
jgi:hypothetical protein